MNNLFICHMGYHDDVSEGVYECHTNIFIVAEDFEEAKKKVKMLDIVLQKKMHIDGMQMINAVEGFQLTLTLNSDLQGRNSITNYNYRELSNKSNK